MVTIITFSTLRTYILGQWNVVVIAKPTINDGKLVKPTLPSNIYISLGKSTSQIATTGPFKKDEIITPAYCVIVALTEADALKYLGELGRIISGYKGSTFWWHIEDFEADDRNKLFKYVITIKERRMITW